MIYVQQPVPVPIQPPPQNVPSGSRPQQPPMPMPQPETQKRSKLGTALRIALPFAGFGVGGLIASRAVRRRQKRAAKAEAKKNNAQ